MKLHVVYRATGKVNAKPRPPGFSKQRSLESFIRAWEACDAAGELIFVNDGPIPAAQLAAMEAAGHVLARDALELHGSYWTAVRLALAAGWAEDDLVYFAEDDYLYRPEALVALVAAAARLPAVDYFSLYATVGETMPNGDPLPRDMRRPGLLGERLDADGDVAWHRATSHTSSFAVRLAALRADRTMHLLAPRCSAAWDHALCLTLQGRTPYGPLTLLAPLHEPSGATPSRRAKIVAWRLVLIAEALLTRHRRRIAAPLPALATHMEDGWLAQGTDWAVC